MRCVQHLCLIVGSTIDLVFPIASPLSGGTLLVQSNAPGFKAAYAGIARQLELAAACYPASRALPGRTRHRQGDEEALTLSLCRGREAQI